MRLLSENAYNRVKKLLSDKMSDVKAIAEALLEKEVLYKDDLELLIGKRPFEDIVFDNHSLVVDNNENGVIDNPIATNPESINP